MNNEFIPTSVALFVCGLFFTFIHKKYLINLIKSTNKFRLIKIDPSNNTVQVMRMIGIGALAIGTIDLIAILFKLI